MNGGMKAVDWAFRPRARRRDRGRARGLEGGRWGRDILSVDKEMVLGSPF